jgi:hypothetical protein
MIFPYVFKFELGNPVDLAVLDHNPILRCLGEVVGRPRFAAEILAPQVK